MRDARTMAASSASLSARAVATNSMSTLVRAIFIGAFMTAGYHAARVSNTLGKNAPGLKKTYRSVV